MPRPPRPATIWSNSSPSRRQPSVAAPGHARVVGREELEHLLHEPDDEPALDRVEHGDVPAALALERAGHQLSFWKVAHRP